MSLKTRLGLLAGSSLFAVGLMALAPQTAAAQTCTPTAATVSGSGPGADTVTCTAGTFATGITYSSNGDLSVQLLAGANSNITANGVNLTGNGTDNVSWTNAGNMIAGTGTAGPLIDVTTVSGDISITTNGVVQGIAASTTHGIRATSTGGGDISITRNFSVNNNTAGGQAAIEAVTNGGNVSITASGAGNTSGRLRGILAQTSGSGTIAISTVANVSASTIDGIAAIDTIAGAGGTTIAINGGTVNGGAGFALRSAGSGAVTIQQLTTAFTTVEGRVDFSGATGGVAWNATRGTWNSSGASVFGSGADILNLDSGSLASSGSIDFGGGADAFNISGNYTLNGVINFGAGADQSNISGALTVAGGSMNFGADADTLTVTGLLNANGAQFDFGAGVDAISQQGEMFAGGLVTISNLEAFDNAGDIYLGGAQDFAGVSATDGSANDILRVSSGVFTGSGDSRILLDANLGAHDSQIGCTTTTAADCVDFTGASTAGSTSVMVQDISFSIDGGTLNTVVTLIEGSSAAEHFTLDPASTYYTQTPQGGAIRKPVVAYYFVYDADNHRHVLVGAPTDEPFQVATFSAAAQEAWRATAGSWITRQADLRSTPGGLEPSRGVWGRIGGQSGERDLTASYATGGVSLDYDLTQKQRIAHLSFGADMIGGPGWVVGATVGFVRSDVEFEATPTEAALTGFSGGLYASYVAGPLFVDGLFNANILHVKADAPQMGIGDDVPMKFDLKSLGGQVEAGWRIPMGSIFVEPLVGVSYVVTRFDDTAVPGGSAFFDFEEAKSMRVGGGARIGMDGELLGMTAGYSLTGRYWNESEGESSAMLTTASGSSAPLLDVFAGDFSELIASLNLFSANGGTSGFVNLGGKFGEDYQAIDGSVGVRVRW